MTSPFLEAPESSWIASNPLAFALRDRFPVSPGHTLVIPRRLVATWFDATPEEHAAIFQLVEEIKRQLDAALHPDGYNIGINAGEAAGQTVMHLHVHVIPRFRGDVDDPRGGVRHVIPGKGNYLAQAAPPLATGGPEDPFLRHIVPLFAQATDISIVAAFVLETGLFVLEDHVSAALERGASVRVITGNYLDITEVGALRKLLAWSLDSARPGRFETRVVDIADLPGRRPSFHPKSWRFEKSPGLAVAFVGSSNISSAALRTGIEWNLRVARGGDPRAYEQVVSAFDRLWTRARRLTAAWIDAYERRIGDTPSAIAVAVAEVDALAPHDIQIEALAALAKSRDELRRRAVVVLATGLGKTWLAAFDAAAYADKNLAGRMPRILFIAHREEILAQAEKTFRWMFYKRRPTVGSFAGSSSELDADLVFASAQKLSRPEHLARLRDARFDYAIVDEVHHGTAQSYRAILDGLDAGFLLGLTATPERADGADVLGLFDDHTAFRADIGIGIQRRLLVPFAYFGLKDAVDYKQITWQNQRFNPDELAAALDTEDRLEQMWRAWVEHPGRRTIVFCCTIQHAEHARAFLSRKGLNAQAVHSGPSSAARAEAIDALEAGAIDALCAVDILNEGVDVPQVDRVVMLRPTESPVVFLQQLGRGLRVAAGKERLTVLDFIGNHRIFLDRLRMLTSFSERPGSVRELLQGSGVLGLPPGCSVEIELEAKDVLLHLLHRSPGGRTAVERAYLEIVDARGIRPTAGELFRMGYPIEALRDAAAGWFDFVAARGGLNEAESRVLAEASEWLRDLETTPMTKSFKMVTLEALLEAGALTQGLPVPDLARRSYAILLRSPELFRDLEDVAGLADPRAADEKRFEAYWRKNPISAWTAGRTGHRWFSLKDDRFVPAMPIPPGDEDTFAAMTRELIDYRLVQYRSRPHQKSKLSVLPLPPRRPIVAYPSLRAAAGAASDPVELPPPTETVGLPTTARSEGIFAVRAVGDSMDGGKRPIRDGDWLVMRVARGASHDALKGKVVLVELPDPDFGRAYQIKRLARAGARWQLRSDNPARPSFEASAETVLLAELLDVIRPEDLGPRPGEHLDEDAFVRAFDLEAPPRTGRVGGHLFLCLEASDALVAPDRIRFAVSDRRPGETAFMLRRRAGEASWEYLGVARYQEDEDLWDCSPQRQTKVGSI